MITHKSHRYASNKRGWRGGKGSVKHQAECIVDSMREHGRDLEHYEPMSDELRAAVKAELASRGDAKASVVDNGMLADILVHIVRATMRKGGNPKLAVEPYSCDVKRIAATKLTHSECVACGLIPKDSPDFIEQALRQSARRVENKRYAAIGYLSLA